MGNIKVRAERKGAKKPILKAKMMANLGECTLLLLEKEHTIVPQNEVPKIAEIR